MLYAPPPRLCPNTSPHSSPSSSTQFGDRCRHCLASSRPKVVLPAPDNPIIQITTSRPSVPSINDQPSEYGSSSTAQAPQPAPRSRNKAQSIVCAAPVVVPSEPPTMRHRSAVERCHRLVHRC